MTIGELIAVARECKGWTLRDLEKASGVSNPLISQIETGKVRDPGFVTVVRLMDALGLSLDRAAKAEREKLKILRTTGVWKPEQPCEACHGTGGHNGIKGGPDSPPCGICGGSGQSTLIHGRGR
ncbi:MAG: helix-turn-helix domain-containing protein [Mesorhizobium sp.]|nr:MAG: helix-turn-helix domain-containing protein [Mesorhizobium sp.]